MEDNNLLKYFDMTNRFNTNKTLRRGNIENSPDYILEIKRPIINKLIPVTFLDEILNIKYVSDIQELSLDKHGLYDIIPELLDNNNLYKKNIFSYKSGTDFILYGVKADYGIKEEYIKMTSGASWSGILLDGEFYNKASLDEKNFKWKDNSPKVIHYANNTTDSIVEYILQIPKVNTRNNKYLTQYTKVEENYTYRPDKNEIRNKRYLKIREDGQSRTAQKKYFEYLINEDLEYISDNEEF